MEWRHHPALKKLFHPDHPDDLPAIIHDGFRAATRSPEKVWITVKGIQNNLLEGILLNEPEQLPDIKQGQQYKFLISTVGIPILVSDEYLDQTQEWVIEIPCNECGNDVLFDTPQELISIAFPDLPEDATMDAFSTFCPLCKGAMVIKHKDAKLDEDSFAGNSAGKPSRAKSKRKWYQIWK